jgi:hypothetical protein
LQVQGNYFSEAKLLNVAHRYQQATDWHQQAPTLALKAGSLPPRGGEVSALGRPCGAHVRAPKEVA